MIVMFEHSENWIDNAIVQQNITLAHFVNTPPQRHKIKRNELEAMPIEQWAFVRLVSGIAGLKLDGSRMIALEPGDAWLGYPGELLDWYQEGAIEFDVWNWGELSLSIVSDTIHRFSDLLLALLSHNLQVVPDPAPGFEFFNSGDIILKEGDSADSVYTLIQGRAKVTVQGQQVGHVKENELIGLQAMLLKTTRTATVVADGPCSAVRVTFDKFCTLIKARPDLVMSTLETMAQQIDRANQRLVDQ